MLSKNKNTIEDSRVIFHKFEIRYSFFNKIVDAAKWIAIAYFSYSAIHDLAGKLTLAKFDLSAVVKQGEECSTHFTLYLIILASVFIAVISMWYGRREARLRKSTVASLTKQIETLQILIDPNRTSSMLTTRGDTAEKDRR